MLFILPLIFATLVTASINCPPDAVVGSGWTVQFYRYQYYSLAGWDNHTFFLGGYKVNGSVGAPFYNLPKSNFARSAPPGVVMGQIFGQRITVSN